MNIGYQKRLVANQRIFSQQFFQFASEVRDLCCVCFIMGKSRVESAHHFDGARCGQGHCIRCWREGHSSTSCSVSRQTLPNGVCWFCYMPQKLFDKKTHPHSASRECEFKDKLLPIVWITFWKGELGSSLAAFGLDTTLDEAQLRRWLKLPSNTDEFMENSKVLNIVTLSMWLYNNKVQRD